MVACRASEAAAATLEVLQTGNEGEIVKAEQRLHAAEAAAQAAEKEAAKAAGMATAHQEVAQSQANISEQVRFAFTISYICYNVLVGHLSAVQWIQHHFLHGLCGLYCSWLDDSS